MLYVLNFQTYECFYKLLKLRKWFEIGLKPKRIDEQGLTKNLMPKA